MLEFVDFVYLDVEKSGSTFARHFFEQFGVGGVVADQKHAPLKSRRRNKLHIISCRDPIASYKSLYMYGGRQIGGFYQLMKRRGHADVYDGTIDGFSRWLDLALEMRSGRIGLQTRRFLLLALPKDTPGRADVLDGHGDAIKAFAEHGLADVILRTESLNDDLAALVNEKGASMFIDPPRALKYLRITPKENVTGSRVLDESLLGAELIRRLQVEESFFFNTLGYPPYLVEAAAA